jgi:methionyl aminopeptidase
VIIIKTPPQIQGIRKSSKLAAATLEYLSKFIQPGICTEKLNTLAHQFITNHHAIPAPLNYGGFPKSICTSLNCVVCHGIPSTNEILKEGDIINLDITTILDGYFGDISATFPVGKITPTAQNLINRTQQALNLAITAIEPNKYLNESVGKVIEDFITPFSFSPVRELGGHGVGLKFHEDPFVFHFNSPQNHILLKPGMIFTVEPMINTSPNWRVNIDPVDGWTVRTTDGALSCQFEHTILVTDSGSEVLTKL